MTVDLRMMMSSKLGLLSPLAEGVASSWKRSVSVPGSRLVPLFGGIKNVVIDTLIEVFILQILVPFTNRTNLAKAAKRTDSYLHECINVFYQGNQNETASLGRWVISKKVQTSNLKPVATRPNLT